MKKVCKNCGSHINVVYQCLGNTSIKMEMTCPGTECKEVGVSVYGDHSDFLDNIHKCYERCEELWDRTNRPQSTLDNAFIKACEKKEIPRSYVCNMCKHSVSNHGKGCPEKRCCPKDELWAFTGFEMVESVFKGGR